MRKWIAFMVALAIAACIGCALAENIDLSGLSDDELLTLENRIQAEIVARRIEGVARCRRAHTSPERTFRSEHTS